MTDDVRQRRTMEEEFAELHTRVAEFRWHLRELARVVLEPVVACLVRRLGGKP
jgi:hypothetical protein